MGYTPENQHVISDDEAAAIAWFLQLGSAVDKGYALVIEEGKLVAIDGIAIERIVTMWRFQA